MTQSNVNIITGQILPSYPFNSNSRRFAANHIFKNRNKSQLSKQIHQQLPQIRKLGTSKDSKVFTYAYTNLTNQKKTRKQNQSTNNIREASSLVNASKSNYNIISHTIQGTPTPQQWNQTKRLSMVSKFTDLGRLHAPNYSIQYGQKIGNNPQDFHKKKDLCNGICQIQRSYGTQKFFRKYK